MLVEIFIIVECRNFSEDIKIDGIKTGAVPVVQNVLKEKELLVNTDRRWSCNTIEIRIDLYNVFKVFDIMKNIR